MEQNAISDESENSNSACTSDGTSRELVSLQKQASSLDSSLHNAADAEHANCNSSNEVLCFFSGANFKERPRLARNPSEVLSECASVTKCKAKSSSKNLHHCPVTSLQNCAKTGLHHDHKCKGEDCKETFCMSHCVKCIKESITCSCSSCNSCVDKERQHILFQQIDEGSLTELKAKIQGKNDEIDALKLKITSLQDEICHMQSFKIRQENKNVLAGLVSTLCRSKLATFIMSVIEKHAFI